MRRPITVHAWNTTNLKAVLDDGAKPQLEKVNVALTRVEEGSDLKWLDGGDAYEFTRRSAYVARDAAEEARLDTEVVGLNPAYLATIAKYGSEGAMLQNLSHVAVTKVADVLDAFISERRLAAVPVYLKGVAADLMATGLALDGDAVWPSTDEVSRQWAGGAVLGGPLSGLSAKYTSFEANVSEATALMLWDTSHQYSLLTEEGSGVWIAALSGDDDAESAIAAVVPEFHSVVSWLSALVDEENVHYLAYVAPALTDMSEEVTSWRDLRGQQFATGAVTRKLQLGDVVAPELPVNISLTPAEANAFLDTFGEVETSLDALATLAPATADIYKTYLYDYLPRDFLLGGFVIGARRADGTGTMNGGLFTRRSLRELLYGYDDALLDLLPAGLVAPYLGLLGSSNISDVSRVGLRTGKRHLSDVGKYTLWRGGTAPLVSPIGFATEQAKPLRQNVKGSLTVWSDDHLRPITLKDAGAVTVKGVEARRVVLDDRTFLSSNCTRKPCFAGNVKYGVDTTGILPMTTVADGAPLAITKTALLDGAYRELFDWLPNHAAEEDSWFAVEPLTGRFVASQIGIERAYVLDVNQLGDEAWKHVFSSTRLEAFPWPHLYTDESDEISSKDAKEFVAMVYGARDQAVIWAVIIGFLGLGLVFVGLHGLLAPDDDKAKTQVWPSPPREQRRPQHGKVEEDLFVEEVKEDPGEEYDDFPVEEPEPARKTMMMTVVHWLPTPYNYKNYRAR